MIPVSEYVSRRQKLFDHLEDGSLAIIFSGVAKKMSYDDDYPFEVNRNFYYLTGIEQEDSVLLLLSSEGERKEFLLVSPFDPVKEKWYGKRLTPEEARELSGVRNVLLNNALNARVDSALRGSFGDFGDIKTVYLDLEKENKIAESTSTNEYKQSLETAYPGVTVKDIYPIIIRQRLIKSAAEIAEFEKAVAHTRLGIQSVMALARPGITEYELADQFLHTINDDSGFQGLSFNTIMAGGRHATTLHYPLPRGVISRGECVLMDLGARHSYYCADVSRTIPVSGKFNDYQRMVYEIVLGCNKAVASFAKPGITLLELQNFAKEYLAGECLSKGIITRKEDIAKYYYHSISHQIGLDTHDPGGDKSLPLAPGMIISDEPGLYIAEANFGCRIEDDLLITDRGCRVLTSSIIKEVADIEAFYAHRK